MTGIFGAHPVIVGANQVILCADSVLFSAFLLIVWENQFTF